MTKKIEGNLIDLHQRKIYPAIVQMEAGRIQSIEQVEAKYDQYILPGFIDAHIHIESSMVVPYEFARIALAHGTVATISDPHEIANVLGVPGVHYMIENARDAKLKFHFGAPSCVPATNFETAGAVIDADDIAKLMASKDIYYLSEMMNYPGVLFKDEQVMRKLEIAKASGKPIDGHAPGLRGEQAQTYIAAGITTDHECFTLPEALDKLQFGMKILIREGSAAKNYDALHTLIKSHPNELMFCSDDKHPDDLLEGHINQLVMRSLALGYDLFDVLSIACLHPIEHYKMDVGSLRVGDKADCIVIDNLDNFKILQTYINGELVADQGKTFLPDKIHASPNNFNIGALTPAQFILQAESAEQMIINALDGELITEKSKATLPFSDGIVSSDPSQDILKISVINRYQAAPIASGFIKNFGIHEGAIASTVAHDSHNIVIVGSHDEYMCKAANLLVGNEGGLSAVSAADSKVIGLPVAGLMSDQPCSVIGEQYAAIDAFAKAMGTSLTAPYMTLSFMALLVIPKIKMSDLGLFDAEAFAFY